MYVFEFSHTLTQTDLQDIWQNLPPDIGAEMEVAEVAITHPLLKKELLGSGGEDGNSTIEIPNKLKWMVFKVKQRASSNYFKKTVLRNPEINTDVLSGDVSQDEFGDTSALQYNWPYDFFSLIEMAKIDTEMEMGNFNENELKNYVDHIPSWEPVEAENMVDVVTSLEDAIPETNLAANIGNLYVSHGPDSPGGGHGGGGGPGRGGTGGGPGTGGGGGGKPGGATGGPGAGGYGGTGTKGGGDFTPGSGHGGFGDVAGGSGGFGGGGGSGGGSKRDMDAIEEWFANEDNDGTMGGSETTVFSESGGSDNNNSNNSNSNNNPGSGDDPLGPNP
jgi:hypothetical protein